MIKKLKSGYRVYSHTHHRNMGTYKTKKKAKERLEQIERFSHRARLLRKRKRLGI